MAKSTNTRKKTTSKSKSSTTHWTKNRSAPVDRTKRIANPAKISEENIISGTRRRKAVDYRQHKVVKTSKKHKAPKSKNTLEERQKAAEKAAEKAEEKE